MAFNSRFRILPERLGAAAGTAAICLAVAVIIVSAVSGCAPAKKKEPEPTLGTSAVEDVGVPLSLDSVKREYEDLPPAPSLGEGWSPELPVPDTLEERTRGTRERGPVMPESPSAGGSGLDVERVVIKTATMLIVVDDVDRARAEVEASVAAVGGEVARVDRRRYKEDDSCRIVVRVPAKKFEEALHSAEGIGEVVQLLVEAEDVTEEYVDLHMRLDNQEKARDRFIEILNTRTGKLEDVVALQREINDTTEDIERLTGKIRYLENRAALSTIHVTLRTPEEEERKKELPKPTIADEFTGALGEALVALVRIIILLIQIAIVVLPLGAAGVLLVIVVRRVILWGQRTGALYKIFGRAPEDEEE